MHVGAPVALNRLTSDSRRYGRARCRARCPRQRSPTNVKLLSPWAPGRPRGSNGPRTHDRTIRSARPVFTGLRCSPVRLAVLRSGWTAVGRTSRGRARSPRPARGAPRAYRAFLLRCNRKAATRRQRVRRRRRPDGVHPDVERAGGAPAADGSQTSNPRQAIAASRPTPCDGVTAGRGCRRPPISTAAKRSYRA